MALPPRIERLTALARRPRRRVLGLMSGTSLDGLDMALCTLTGSGSATQLQLDQFKTAPYSPQARARLREVVFRPTVDLAALNTLHAWLAAEHAASVLDALRGWGVAPGEVHLLASHGQTVHHAPSSWTASGWTEQGQTAGGAEPGHTEPVAEAGIARHATLQLGDGDLLAVRTGILTVSDLRQKDIALGGEGAPLAPYADALLFAGETPRVLINLGGIANFTWLPARGAAGRVCYGDTGPANALLDRAVRKLFPEHPDGYDRHGALAIEGRSAPALLARLKSHPYFARACPKSTGPEVFGDAYLDTLLGWPEAQGMAPHDLLATLTALTVQTVAEALLRACGGAEGGLDRAELYVSGGGRHNRALADGLRAALPSCRWCEADALGIPPDAKEAVLFAVLAHESLFGEGFVPLHDPTAPPFAFGKLSFPR